MFGIILDFVSILLSVVIIAMIVRGHDGDNSTDN